jgi:hypothetical protein
MIMKNSSYSYLSLKNTQSVIKTSSIYTYSKENSS